jgi:hypothetical protein
VQIAQGRRQELARDRRVVQAANAEQPGGYVRQPEFSREACHRRGIARERFPDARGFHETDNRRLTIAQPIGKVNVILSMLKLVNRQSHAS